jgi:tRNA(adenine34) deaminase
MKPQTFSPLWLALSVLLLFAVNVPSLLALQLPRKLTLKQLSFRGCVPTIATVPAPESAVDTPFIPFQVRFAGDTNTDEIGIYFMKLALKQAAAAAVQGEVPIGAVVVRKSMDNSSHLNSTTTMIQSHPDQDLDPEQEQVYVVLSVARNAVEATHDASAHAELLALRAAAVHQQPPNWRLNMNGNGRSVNTQYTSSATTTTTTLYSTLEPCPMCLTAAQAFRIDSIVYGANDDRLGAVTTHMRLLQDYQHPFHNITSVTAGVEATASSEMLRAFFRQRRLEQKQNKQQRKQHEKQQQQQQQQQQVEGEGANGAGGGVTKATQQQQQQQQERRHWLSWRWWLRRKSRPTQ